MCERPALTDRDESSRSEGRRRVGVVGRRARRRERRARRRRALWRSIGREGAGPRARRRAGRRRTSSGSARQMCSAVRWPLCFSPSSSRPSATPHVWWIGAPRWTTRPAPLGAVVLAIVVVPQRATCRWPAAPCGHPPALTVDHARAARHVGVWFRAICPRQRGAPSASASRTCGVSGAPEDQALVARTSGWLYSCWSRQCTQSPPARCRTCGVSESSRRTTQSRRSAWRRSGPRSSIPSSGARRPPARCRTCESLERLTRGTTRHERARPPGCRRPPQQCIAPSSRATPHVRVSALTEDHALTLLGTSTSAPR